jgi:hypothetical protein
MHDFLRDFGLDYSYEGRFLLSAELHLVFLLGAKRAVHLSVIDGSASQSPKSDTAPQRHLWAGHPTGGGSLGANLTANKKKPVTAAHLFCADVEFNVVRASHHICKLYEPPTAVW